MGQTEEFSIAIPFQEYIEPLQEAIPLGWILAGDVLEVGAQEDQAAGAYVTGLREQVQTLAKQHADEMKGYIGWSEHMGEQHGRLNAHVEKLTKAYNELARLLEEG